MQGQH